MKDLSKKALQETNGGIDWITWALIEEIIDVDLNGDGTTGFPCLVIPC